MPFLLRSIGDFIPVKMEFITVKFWPYGQPISRPARAAGGNSRIVVHNTKNAIIYYFDFTFLYCTT